MTFKNQIKLATDIFEDNFEIFFFPIRTSSSFLPRLSSPPEIGPDYLLRPHIYLPRWAAFPVSATNQIPNLMYHSFRQHYTTQTKCCIRLEIRKYSAQRIFGRQIDGVEKMTVFFTQLDNNPLIGQQVDQLANGMGLAMAVCFLEQKGFQSFLNTLLHILLSNAKTRKTRDTPHIHPDSPREPAP